MASPFMQPPSQPHSPLSSAQDAPLIKPNTPPSMDPFSLNSTVMQDVSQRRAATPRQMGAPIPNYRPCHAHMLLNTLLHISRHWCGPAASGVITDPFWVTQVQTRHHARPYG